MPANGDGVAGWVFATLESTSDYAVVFLTPDGVIKAWLGAAAALFGYSADEAVGQPFSMLFTPEDVAFGEPGAELGLALTSGRAVDDRWHLRKDGELFWASGVMTAIREGDAIVSICKIVRDKTGLRTQLEALQHQVAARDTEIERRRTFVASAVHELRNPLLPISMALNLLKRVWATRWRRARSASSRTRWRS